MLKTDFTAKKFPEPKSRRKALAALLLVGCLARCLLPGPILGAGGPAAETEAGGPAADGYTAADGSLIPYGGFEKIETVYVDTDYTGAPASVIVSDWLKNSQGRGLLLDISPLSKIKSLKDGQSLSLGEDHRLIWKVEDGADVYYQGQSDREPPVGLSITYELEGRQVTAEELAGQSGHVRVRYQYTNQLVETRSVKGQKAAIYNPFTLVTTLSLPEGVFSNVTVEKGRYMDLGGGGTIIGYGCPGLRETLGADNDLFDVPDWFAFSADAKDFRLDAVTTIALPEFALSDMLDSLDKIDELLADLSELSDGSQDLVEGCDDFTDGVAEMADGLRQYIDGADEVGRGLAELADQLPGLTDGIQELLDASQRLAGGAGEMAGAISASARELPEMSDGIQEMLDGIYSLCLNLDSAAESLRAGLPGEEELTRLEAGLGPALALQEQRAREAAAQGDPSAPAEGLIYSLLQQYQTSLIPMLRYTLPSLAGGLNSMSGGLSEIWDGLKELKDGTGQLQEGLDQLEEGLWQLESGQQAVSDGLNQLGEGALGLRDGAEQLHGAAEELMDAGQELDEGMDALREGAADLTDGVAKLHTDGILELEREFNKNFYGMADRRDAMLELGEAYQSFTGLPPGVKGEVKFVFQTPEISEKETPPPSGPGGGEEVSQPSFFQRIGQWLQSLWEKITGFFR